MNNSYIKKLAELRRACSKLSEEISDLIEMMIEESEAEEETKKIKSKKLLDTETEQNYK